MICSVLLVSGIQQSDLVIYFSVYVYMCVHVCLVASVVSDSLQTYELYLARLLLPWGFPAKNTGVGCYALLQGIFPT